MTPDELTQLIADGETLTVEFKSDSACLSDQDLLEALVCLANTSGGTLLIGVENNGQITGLHKKHLNFPPSYLSAMVANRTVPPLSVETEIINFSEIPIAIVKVPPATQLVSTSDGRTLKRILNTQGQPECRPLYPSEINSWYADRGQRDVSARLMTGTTWNDLDPLEFVRLRRLLTEYRGDTSLQDLTDLELAKALNLVRGDDAIPTLAGLLIVGKETVINEHIPTHEVAFQVLRGQDVAVNEFYRWPLLRIFERLMEAFSLRNEEHELTIDLFRVGVPAYDPRAFREAVNNALTHRDYNRMGAVHIQIHDDSLIIRNPGGFVEGIRLDSLLISGPLPRNPLLADIFKRIGLVERTGRGIGLIYSGQLRTGHQLPDYSATTNINVAVRLPGGDADLEFVKIILAEEKRQQQPLNLDELILLNYLWQEKEINITEAGRLIQKREDHARHLLEQLMENGLVERIKTARQREYHLSASVYRQMGRSSAYIRRSGFDNLQKEQMILKYTKTNGRITRGQTAELCRINNRQARHLLEKLANRGILKHMGIGGRSGYYILNEDENISTNLLENTPEIEKNKQKNNKIISSDMQEKSKQIKQTKSEHSKQLELDLFQDFDSEP
ncbi:RNA-binding domain-containing protein [Sphaerospermopsis torques-reginae]|uniref:DNA binding domain-containing protein n=1 Tax=Sphaerospermopsis torques-reginae ITEP-024 TaxID=984208 RepID=A0ABX8WUJ4_9CYAN|nr:RNA-binding domain-containing protein [Sphaerospermopsis torques-reginae]QYX30096.1 putative DNA binding domain-containing protein [Sphaerospermopsis torques-reginae ITEP-024]